MKIFSSIKNDKKNLIYIRKFIILSNQKRHDQEVKLLDRKEPYNVFEIRREEVEIHKNLTWKFVKSLCIISLHT